jgi:RNA polymerase sigma-70 factor (ECF subfamily)
MPTETGFADFLRRLRAGDEEAAAELVRRYEPFIRREVRMRLTDPRLFRLIDSVDICQSVLRSFFVRAAAGQYDLEEPRDLRNLLLAMARNKLTTRYRRVLRQEPEPAPAAGSAQALERAVDQRPGAEQLTEARDLLGQILRHLTEEERQLAELRGQGCSWPEVAAQVGGTADARRKQLARCLDRVLRQLRLEDEA